MVGRSAVRRTASQKLAGDSWFHYVWIRESMQMFWVLLVRKEARRLPVWPSELSDRLQSAWWKVESTMWIRRNDGLCCFSIFIKEAIRSIHTLCSPRSTPTCLLMLSHWEMTRDCHFWLQILDFYKWKPGAITRDCCCGIQVPCFRNSQNFHITGIQVRIKAW